MSFELNPHELAHFAVTGWGALQKIDEFAPLLTLLDTTKPRVVLEIGCGNCGSTWAISKLSSVEHIIVIDLPAGPWGGNDRELTEKRLNIISQSSGKPVYFISGNSQSQECLEEVKGILDKVKGLDFLFIDGDHSYGGVKTDYLNYSPLVSPGGLVAFHDIAEHAPETGCEVKKFWEEVKDSGIPKDQYVEFLSSDGQAWGGLGVIKW